MYVLLCVIIVPSNTVSVCPSRDGPVDVRRIPLLSKKQNIFSQSVQQTFPWRNLKTNNFLTALFFRKRRNSY